MQEPYLSQVAIDAMPQDTILTANCPSALLVSYFEAALVFSCSDCDLGSMYACASAAASAAEALQKALIVI